jgi:hypothetical protein
MGEALKKTKTAHQEIWTEEPNEIKRLTSIKGAWDQGASTVLFAATKLATLITFLNHMRGIAQRGEVDLETMKKVTEPYLGFHASVYGNHYQFADTAQVVRWAAEGVSKVDTLADYATLVGELAIYLNRIDYWVDMKIPWAKFGRVFEGELAE